MNPMLHMLLFVVDKAVTILTILIIIRAIMSWVPDLNYRYRDFSRFLDKVTSPVIAPFRRILSPYRTGGIDLSPMLAIIALRVAQGLLGRLLVGIMG